MNMGRGCKSTITWSFIHGNASRTIWPKHQIPKVPQYDCFICRRLTFSAVWIKQLVNYTLNNPPNWNIFTFDLSWMNWSTFSGAAISNLLSFIVLSSLLSNFFWAIRISARCNSDSFREAWRDEQSEGKIPGKCAFVGFCCVCTGML